MTVWLLALCALLLCVAAGLGIKLALMRRSAREIEAGLSLRLETETNTLIGISSRDKAMTSLAAALNSQLRLLRAERRRFQQGDLELKEAVTNISHDLRTPLTAICGYLSLLEKEDVSPEARRYLHIISGRAQALKTLTEELFCYSVSVSGGEDMPLETADLRRALEAAVAANYALLHENSVTPVISMPEEPVLCLLNPAAIARVFGNILSNAAKYSPGDLDIALSAEGCVTFTNTAPGLDPVQVGRLFDRFYTVETAGSSTGLGLSIAKALAERMQGRITAEYAGGRLIIRLSLKNTPDGA